MDYLFKIFYKDKANHEPIYKSRIELETTLKTNLIIKPYMGHDQYPLYYVYNNKTASYIDKLRKNDSLLSKLESFLPSIAKYAFLVDIISSELKSSNDLEGIETNKEEISETTRNILKNDKPKSYRLNSMVNSYILLIAENDLKVPKDFKDIRKIYDEITRGEIEDSNKPDGRYFRKEDVFVQKKGSYSGEFIHKGIAGEENIENAIFNLLTFMDDQSILELLKLAIAHYYFGYIHPFYDGNGRVGRFISSLYIRQEYTYLTAMSLSRGSLLEKNNYYKAFKETNSNNNKGEMNYFIDEFLSMLIKGQEDILSNLSNKLDKLNYSKKCIEEDEKLDSPLKKELIFMLAQSYYFDYNSGIEREEFLEDLKDKYPISRIKAELKELESAKVIKAVKKRPLIYAIDDEYFSSF